MPDDLRAAIAAVFEELGPPTNKAAELALAIDNLAVFGQARHLPEDIAAVRLRSYRGASRKTSEAELDKITRTAEKLVAALEGLHAPALRALTQCGAGTAHGDPYLRALRHLAERARAAKDQIGEDESGAGPEQRHKPFAVIIARVVIFHYLEIFPDRRPDLPSGAPGLEGLLRKIFVVLGIRESHKAALRAAIEERAAAAATVRPAFALSLRGV
jgi:hypothetical protein